MDRSNLYAHAAMLIRKPIADVFRAFTDPEVTTNFWFTKSSGKLEEGNLVTWTWEMFNLSQEVKVQEVVPNEKILVSWGNRGQETTVEWEFKSLDASRTFVSVTNRGFQGTTDDLISGIRDSTGGFSWVLAGAKAYLEHGIQLNLIADRYPPELGEH